MSQHKTISKTKARVWENIRGYLFIAPNLIGFLFFVLLPVIFCMILTFTEWNILTGLNGIKFVGLRNFIKMWSDEWFTKSLINNIYYAGVSVPLTMVLALLCAVALNSSIVSGKGLLRTMFFMPYITNVVAVSAVWMMLLSMNGPINSVLRSLGVTDPPVWLMSQKYAMPALIVMSIWNHAGYVMVIYLAALQAIPKELYEACKINGGNSFQSFRYITVPLISPTTFFILITQIISSFKVFGQINIMTHGGPGTATTVLVYYIYQSAYQFYNMGYAAAMAWVLFGVIFSITLIQWWGQKRWVSYL